MAGEHSERFWHRRPRRGGGAGGGRAAGAAGLPGRPPRPLRGGVREIAGVRVHCDGSPRLPTTSHFAVAGVEAQSLLIRLDLAGYAVSTGSACASGTVEPSAALLALGLSPEEALGSLRVSVGMPNTAAEVDGFFAVLAHEAAELRRLAGRREPAAVP